MQSRKSGGKNPSYDLFISHASEDKDDIVRPLAKALIARGLEVCFNEDDLRVGGSIAREMNERINTSRFAVTILSRAYIDKDWASYELDMLVYLAMSTGRKILPVWHNMVADDLEKHTLFFSTVVGLDTGEHCIETIADEIYYAVSLDAN